MSAPAHSNWPASGFEAMMLCPGKKVMEAGNPDRTSIDAATGTAAHQVLTWCLQSAFPTHATAFIGRMIDVGEHTIEVTDDMAEAVQVCIDYVRDVVGDDGVLFVDQKVNYSRHLAVPWNDAWGTADVIIAKGEEIVVIDYKHGRGVQVEAVGNPQMSLYALGALESFGLAAEFVRVRMVISQPRVSRAPAEWDIGVEDLLEWAAGMAQPAVARCQAAAEAAASGMAPVIGEHLVPGEKQCRFCRARATCPALRAEVATTVQGVLPASPEEFAVVELFDVDSDCDEVWIAACLSKVDLIEDWCKAVRAEAERRLLAGESVPGFKVVQGKRGARAWSDPKAAEELMRKKFRLTVEQAYDLKLISPTSAEKLAKAGTIGPRQWPALKELITQSDGKPHVAPASDPRPALEITPAVEDFADLTDLV